MFYFCLGPIISNAVFFFLKALKTVLNILQLWRRRGRRQWRMMRRRGYRSGAGQDPPTLEALEEAEEVEGEQEEGVEVRCRASSAVRK